MLELTDRLKQHVSRDMRRRILKARFGTRFPTSAFRALPDFLIIGGQRCGTSSLYRYLGSHPAIFPSLRKETEYFSRKHGYGLAWYRAHFPLRATMKLWHDLRGQEPLTFEATPDYLFYPHAAERAVELLPGAKIIALLRDPVERAWSHYQHMLRLGYESLSFENALAAEEERVSADKAALGRNPLHYASDYLRFSYVERGLYASHLSRWLDVFAPERFFIARSEDFFADPGRIYGEILAFLDATPWRPRNLRNFSYATGRSESKGDMPAHLRLRLETVFAPHNERLNALVSRDFGWSSGGSSLLRAKAENVITARTQPLEYGGRETVIVKRNEGVRGVATAEAAVRIDPRTGVREEHEFLGPPEEQILCSAHLPSTRARAGVVLCSSVRSEFETNYRREIVLARALAARGLAVQRFQYAGTGNSGGATGDLTLETMERDAVAATGRLVERDGIERLAFVGTRLGGSVAARLAAAHRSAPLVLWEPIVNVEREFRNIFRARRFWAAKDEAVDETAGQRGIDELFRSGVVDVMGHPIHLPLYESVIARPIEKEIRGCAGPILIVQLGARESLRRHHEALAGVWRRAGLDVSCETADEQESWWLEPPGERQDKRVLVSSPAVDVTCEWLARRMCEGEEA